MVESEELFVLVYFRLSNLTPVDEAEIFFRFDEGEYLNSEWGEDEEGVTGAADGEA